MKTNKTALLLMAAAIALIVLGAASGQQTAVLQKASQICMECIGLG
ncbi:MAG: thioredoxin [Clostridia bacterium]|nr:thioredoxin [Clostridia bacterium]